jgi:hypothetical protein
MGSKTTLHALVGKVKELSSNFPKSLPKLILAKNSLKMAIHLDKCQGYQFFYQEMGIKMIDVNLIHWRQGFQALRFLFSFFLELNVRLRV